MLLLKNAQIRTIIENSRLKKYEIASEMGIAETSFSRMFRKELTQKQIEKISAAIQKLKETK